jgi:aerobic carbon-monoxide dehydrogenase medium subunit
MIPAAFDYVRASSAEEAMSLLAEHGEDAKLLAGGHSLLPLMKLRLAQPAILIDVGRLDDLRGIRDAGDHVAIGALTRHRQVETSDLLKEQVPILPAATSQVGDPQVRHRGTIGGSIAHVDPASDLPPLLLALDAEVVARSLRGDRVIPMTEFFVGPFTSALEPDEIVTEIRLPAPSEAYGSAYASIIQPASGYAIAGAAAVVGRKSGGSGPIDDVRVAITGVGEVPYRATAVERAFLDGGDPAAAASHATDGITANTDIHADSEYRAAVAVVQVRRALEAAIARAG